MQDIQYKANNGQFNIDEAQGIVECFVAGIGNKDAVGDIVSSGAFAKSLVRRKPRVVWGHNWNDPIGKVLEIYEVPPNDPRLPQKMKIAGIGGLYAKVQFNLNSEKGREAFTNVAFFGEEQEWSIGYKTLDAIYDNSKQANVLREVELYELSPVLHGANQLTGTISVKTDEEKAHMMHMAGGPAVAVAERPETPVDPFAQGIAQPAGSDRTAALEQELSSRTGGPVKIMKANESSVVFLKPGKGLFRLGYHFNGEQYMFGKPEKLGATMIVQPAMPNQGMPFAQPRPQRVPNFPNVQGKPSVQQPVIPVRYGDGVASGFFDSNEKGSEKEISDLANILDEKTSIVQGGALASRLAEIVNSLQTIIGQHEEKSELLIPCPVEHIFETKTALDPVFDYHRIETYVTEDGIVIASSMSADAYEAVETATKGLIGRIGRIGRGIGGGGKVRRGRAALARIEGVLDPRTRRDVDRDGMIFDGTWREMPDPTRFAQQALRGARSESNPPNRKPKKRIPPKSTTAAGANIRRGTAWYQDLPPEKKPLPVLLTETEKKKITGVFDTYFAGPGKDLPEDHILRRVAKEISAAKQATVGEMGRGTQIKKWLPNINRGDLEELRAVWPDVKGDFEVAGAPAQNRGAGGQRGRSVFEILNTIVDKGEYERTNKGTGGGGGAAVRDKNRERVARGSADSTRRAGKFLKHGEHPLLDIERVQRRDTDGKPMFDKDGKPVMRETGDIKAHRAVTRKNGKLVFDPNSKWIENGVLPSNWMTMDATERVDWWFDNSDKVKEVAVPKEGQATQKLRREMLENYKTVEDLVMEDYDALRRSDDDEVLEGPSEEEKLQRTQLRELLDRMDVAEEGNRRTVRVGRTTEKLPEPKDTPEQPDKDTPKQPEKGNQPKYEKAAEAVANMVKKETLREGLVSDVEEILGRMVNAIYDDDDKETRESLLEAAEILDQETISLMENHRNLNKDEYKIINALRMIRESLEEDAKKIKPSTAPRGKRRQGRDTEGELEIESDAVRILGGRGRVAERQGARAEGDEDQEGDAVDRGYESGVEGFDRTAFGEETLDGDDDDNRGARSQSDRAIQRAVTFQRAYARRQESRGARSTSGTIKSPRTMVTAESTWWKKIGDSLRTEIDKAETQEIRKGLSLLRDLITKYEAGAFKPNSRRTNVGSIKITAKEADLILDSVMAVVDRQQTAGRGNAVGSRSEIFAELLEKVSLAAMSTFIDKTSKPIDEDGDVSKRRR